MPSWKRSGLKIRYQREDVAISERRIEPHYLLLKYPVWYVISFDHLRRGHRTFRCDQILDAKPAGSSFRLRPKSEFQHMWEGEDLLG